MNIQKHTDDQFSRTEKINTYDFGQFFRYLGGDETLDIHFNKGEIYPIVELGIHHISNSVHNVTLFIPLHLRNSSDEEKSVVVGVLESYFKHVAATDARSERDTELKVLADKTMAIQASIKEALVSPHSVMEKIAQETNEAVVEARSKLDLTVPELPSPTVAKSNTHSIVQTSSGNSIDVIKKQLENQKYLGEVISVYSKEKQKELNFTMKCAASINSEEARAAQGLANSMLEKVSDVDGKIEQLTLYSGENVDVEVIIDAPESTSKDKITLFSCLIYCDEEMVTHRLFSDGEFDYRDTNLFFERLKNDKGFRDRILPTDRCIVVARPRRTQKTYSDNPFWDAFQNKPNFETFTLIKDGERLSAVFSPIDAQKRLFPTQSEIDSYFEHVAGIDDAELTKSQKRLKKLNENYTKFAAVLQGILDRQEHGETIVFGELPVHQHLASLFDPALIAQNINFVNDEDYLVSNGTLTNSAHAWLNGLFTYTPRRGDLILCDRDILTTKSARHLFYYGRGQSVRDPRQDWAFDEPSFGDLKLVSINEKLTPYVNVSVASTSYSSDKKKVTSIALNDCESLIRVNAINPSELEVMLQSRVARPEIKDKMRQLVSARDAINNILVPNTKDAIASYQSAFPDSTRSFDDTYSLVLNWALKNGLNPLKPLKLSKRQLRELSIAEQSVCELTDELIEQNKDTGRLFIGHNGLHNILVTRDNEEALSYRRYLTDIPESDKPIYNPDWAIYGVSCFILNEDGTKTLTNLDSNELSGLEVLHDYMKKDTSSYFIRNNMESFVVPTMQAMELIESSKNRKSLDEIETLAKIVDEAKVSTNLDVKVSAIKLMMEKIQHLAPRNKLHNMKHYAFPILRAYSFIIRGDRSEQSYGDFNDTSRNLTGFKPNLIKCTFNPLAAMILVMRSAEHKSAEQNELNKLVSEFMSRHHRMTTEVICKYINGDCSDYHFSDHGDFLREDLKLSEVTKMYGDMFAQKQSDGLKKKLATKEDLDVYATSKQ